MAAKTFPPNFSAKTFHYTKNVTPSKITLSKMTSVIYVIILRWRLSVYWVSLQWLSLCLCHCADCNYAGCRGTTLLWYHETQHNEEQHNYNEDPFELWVQNAYCCVFGLSNVMLVIVMLYWMSLNPICRFVRLVALPCKYQIWIEKLGRETHSSVLLKRVPRTVSGFISEPDTTESYWKTNITLLEKKLYQPSLNLFALTPLND